MRRNRDQWLESEKKTSSERMGMLEAGAEWQNERQV